MNIIVIPKRKMLRMQGETVQPEPISLPNIVAAPAATMFIGILPFGPDAGRPLQPAPGMVYIATDTEIFYVCFIAGNWTTLTQGKILRTIDILTSTVALTGGGGKATRIETMLTGTVVLSLGSYP